MRGYFGIGSERISKAMNLGAMLRTGHAFGASFMFTIGAAHNAREVDRSDTSKTHGHVPLYAFDDVDALVLPKGCALVGVELDARAVDLPTFRHPTNAAYLFGPEKGDLSDAAKAQCAHLVKIPMKFCVNLSVAAALVMYDRLLQRGGYPPRATAPGAPPRADWTKL
ncbi:MAG: RNA methyltransferase [Pseudomonadota bacterium]